MSYYQSIESSVDEVDQQKNTGKLENDQPSQSQSPKKKRQRRLTKKTLTSGLQNLTPNEPETSINRQYSPSNFPGIISPSGYPPGYASYRTYPTSPWFFPQQAQHVIMQAAQNAMQLNPTNPWLLPPFVTSSSTPYSNSQYSQNSYTMPTVQNPISSTYYRNQRPAWQNPSVTSGMFPYPPLGTKLQNELPSPRYGEPNSSTNFQSNGSMATDVFRPSLGSTSPFQLYKRPSNDEPLPSELPDPVVASQCKENSTSIFNFDTAMPSVYCDITGPSENQKNVQENDQTDEKTVSTSNDNEKYDFSCVICHDTKKDTVLIPCRHLCVCEKCSRNIEFCPMCRNKFDELMTVYT